ncbi:T9SS type A sorting domain-containing protein [Candidatus Poribacteria bacterium]|nr:T9SS type A sorting domain-containing protein [Candidatus Poribacteria bacterium]
MSYIPLRGIEEVSAALFSAPMGRYLSVAFGNVAGAPSAHPLSATQVAQGLRLAKRETAQLLQTSRSDRFSYERGIQVLERLLRTLAPQRTALLANYPNPFNPETWIPYQLAESVDVNISIYSTDGQLVRTLSLGYQPVGIYESRLRAAYWDGRNTVGESVASGAYFYTLTAGDFTATRKMLILK